MRIMIVDDSKFMRTIIRDTLEEAGHEIVVEVDNGADALSSYRLYGPDVVTMDVTMTGKDGLKAVEEITAVFPDAKIIVISALNENTLRLNKSEINAIGFLTKPFQKHELLNLIEKNKK